MLYENQTKHPSFYNFRDFNNKNNISDKDFNPVLK